MKIFVQIVVSIFIVLSVSHCANTMDTGNSSGTPAHLTTVNNSIACEGSNSHTLKYYLANNDGTIKSEAVRVSGAGYGAPPKKYYPENQRRLMAMRASKIDAYRSLAETVSGLHIWGGTTIGDMVVQKDRYRVFLDTFVRGARIVEVSGQEDGNFETIVEAVVNQDFLSYILPDNPACGGSNVASPKMVTENQSVSNFYYSE